MKLNVFIILSLIVVAVTGLFISSTGARANTGDDGKGTPYILLRSDNICGINTPRSISNPAVLNYSKAFAATPQSKKMKKEGIEPTSAEGIILTSKAEELVRDVCLDVQEKKRLCSIWKRIRRRDGEALPDVTPIVLKLLRAAEV